MRKKICFLGAVILGIILTILFFYTFQITNMTLFEQMVFSYAYICVGASSVISLIIFGKYNTDIKLIGVMLDTAVIIVSFTALTCGIEGKMRRSAGIIFVVAVLLAIFTFRQEKN